MQLENFSDDMIVERIKELCAKKKITRYRLSINSGIAQSSLSTMLNRKTLPSIPTLVKLCKGFNISLSQFFANTDEYPDLTPDQAALLQTWDRLDDHQKDVVRAFIAGLTSK